MDEQFLPQNETPATEEVVTDEDTSLDTTELDEDTLYDDTAEEVPEEEEDDPLAGAFQHYEPEAPQKKTWPIVLLAILLVIVFVVGMLWAFGAIGKKPSDDTKDPDGTKAPDSSSVGTEDVSDLIAVESPSFQVTNGMFAFFMEYEYQTIQAQYGSMLSSLGLDPSVSTKTQTLYTGEGTWFDYFKDLSTNNVTWMLPLYEAAKKDGVTLDETTTAQLEDFLTSIDFSTFHNGVTEEDARAFLEMYYTAATYEESLLAAMHHSADEVQAKYDADPKAFNVCGYTHFILSIGEGGHFATKEAAADTVASLTAAKTPEEFREAVVAYLMTTGGYKTKEEAAAAYDANAVKSNAPYSADDGISDWLFAADTAVGSIKKVENESTIAVYMLAKAPARDTTKTVNVRHILLTADTYESDEAAKAKADAVLAEWKAGEATGESFGALAAQYTEDPGSATDGLYTGVTKGQMVAEFDAWCFDEARKVGDSGIVKTTHGYHVMYFDGAQEMWYTAVEAALDNEAYEAILEQYKKDYPLTFNEDNIDQIDM